MNDDTRFDPVDDELRRRFADSGVSPSDPDVVLDSMRPRLQRARTRRRVAFTGAVATVAVVVAAVSFALAGGGGTSVRTPPASHSTGPRPEPPVPSTAPGGVTTPTVDDHGGSTGATDDPAVSGTTPSGDSSSPGPDTGAGANAGDGTSATPTTVPAAAEQPTYSSDGGSITILFANGQVSLVSNTPAAGFTAEVHDNGPTRVEVRFTNGQGEWRIRVDIVNGQLVPDVTQH